MTHVRLVGPDDGGRNLVVETAEGEHYSLPVTDELRALVTHVEAEDGTRVPFLPPREIQRRLRAGFTSEDLSRLSGVPIESIRRYEGPVLAERAFIAELARAAHVGRDPSSPIFGELVMDRLASRGVPGASVTWDAWRVAGSPWRVALAYEKDGKTVQAVWTFDHLLRTVVAEDAESRWLTETDILDTPASPRHLAPVGRPVLPRPAPPTPEALSPATGTAPEATEAPEEPEGLLEHLQAKRGVREAVSAALEEDDEEFEGFGPQRLREAEIGFAAGGAAPSRPRSSRRPRHGGRAQMPKWDEIVFGATTDES
ncbi:MAG: DUF3071 domain-containing protein [Demequinaceae bacterium]|nr:DUF3071 domain-containing protein [Demequinaceae bacterium]